MISMQAGQPNTPPEKVFTGLTVDKLTDHLMSQAANRASIMLRRLGGPIVLQVAGGYAHTASRLVRLASM